MAANSRQAGSPVNAYPVVIGANHKSASLTLRDALFMADAAVPAFLESLRAAGISQAMVISTCDRTEVVTAECAVDEVAEIITLKFAETTGVSPADWSDQLYLLEGEEAREHLFSVATSLDGHGPGEAAFGIHVERRQVGVQERPVIPGPEHPGRRTAALEDPRRPVVGDHQTRRLAAARLGQLEQLG